MYADAEGGSKWKVIHLIANGVLTKLGGGRGWRSIRGQ